jgi:hypothetical protein
MPPIPGTESMTDKERRRHRAKVLHDMGLGLGEISRRLGVHYNTAARWLNPEFRKKALAAEARWKASERGVQMRRSWHRNAYTTNKFKFKLIQCRSQAKTMGYAGTTCGLDWLVQDLRGAGGLANEGSVHGSLPLHRTFSRLAVLLL